MKIGDKVIVKNEMYVEPLARGKEGEIVAIQGKLVKVKMDLGNEGNRYFAIDTENVELLADYQPKHAKEMFESLGFKDTNSDESTINYVIQKGMITGFVRFYVMQREYRIWIPSKYDNVPVEWHKAIHQQMLELGWLDEEL